MRVLVLGANGFVGRRIVAALAASDWATPVAGTRRSGTPGSVEQCILDATDADAVARAVSGIDAVVNCVVGTAPTMLANARALAATEKRLVHLSSMAVYGSSEGPIDEDTPMLADTGPYAAAKAEAERLLAPARDVVVLRPGCIYGPGSRQWTHRIAALLSARRIGDLGAAGDGYTNLVYIDDAVAAVLSALRSTTASGRAFNLAMPDAPDWNDYFRTFAKALGAVPLRRVPHWRMAIETKILAPPLKIAERVTGDALPPIPPSLARLWRQDIRLDPALAGSVLGIEWTPLDQGLARSAEWYRDSAAQ